VLPDTGTKRAIRIFLGGVVAVGGATVGGATVGGATVGGATVGGATVGGSAVGAGVQAANIRLAANKTFTSKILRFMVFTSFFSQKLVDTAFDFH
jgi:hypothetical protein